MIILSSNSPRRHEILYEFGILHKVIPANINEEMDKNLTPIKNVERLSYLKAKSIFENYPNEVVIGADTIVVIDNEILGKPHDEIDAYNMLKKLSGKCHQVITGVSILSKDHKITFSDISNVYFKEMSDNDIYNYIHNDYVYDKAGSYAIQSPYMTYIDHIEGSYYNIVGLPIEKVKEYLEINKLYI